MSQETWVTSGSGKKKEENDFSFRASGRKVALLIDASILAP